MGNSQIDTTCASCLDLPLENDFCVKPDRMHRTMERFCIPVSICLTRSAVICAR